MEKDNGWTSTPKVANMRYQQRLGDLASHDFPPTDQCTFSQTRRSDGATPTNGHRLISPSYNDNSRAVRLTFTKVVFPVPPSPTKYSIYDVPGWKDGELHASGNGYGIHRVIGKLTFKTSDGGKWWLHEPRTSLKVGITGAWVESVAMKSWWRKVNRWSDSKSCIDRVRRQTAAK